jgi:hypothetical protein
MHWPHLIRCALRKNGRLFVGFTAYSITSFARRKRTAQSTMANKHDRGSNDLLMAV